MKDKKKQKAAIKEKRKKGLLPEKKEEPSEEEWEDDEEEDEDEEAENGLFDMEAEESEGDESEDEELGGVRSVSNLPSEMAAHLLTIIIPDHISSGPPKRERHRLRIRG